MADTTKFPGKVELSGEFSSAISVADATDASSKTTGAVKVAGGISCEKKLHVGTSITSDSGDLALVAGTLHVQNGGTVTQGTSKSTTVVLNNETGQITMHDAALGAATAVEFTVTNSKCAATDVAIVNHVSTGTGQYIITPHTMASGSFKITITNITSGALSEALVLRFVLVKGSHT
jgi:hypothetical protein